MKERIEIIRAMETLARAINDEEVFEEWLIWGVADGDIDEDTKDEDIAYYAQKDTFSELMATFLRVMTRAKKSGGLYVDGVLSK